MTRRFCAHLVAVLAIGFTAGASVHAQIAQIVPPTRSAERLIHRFDFDERGSGNVEDLPRYWDAFRPSGFPRFTAEHSGFDFTIGHGDAASFRLVSEGRNVAYLYSGPETPVQPGTSCLVAAFIRGRGLDHARARLSAVYVDGEGRPIVASMVSSAYVGGVARQEPRPPGADWQRVEMTIPAAPPEAATLGLIAWVVQEPAWDVSQRPRRYIDPIDVHAAAWFDDIVIHALPRIALRTSVPGNVLSPGAAQDIEVLLSDYSDATLAGALRVLAPDGRIVLQRTVPVSLGAAAEAQRFAVADLPSGLYEAELTVMAAGAPVVTQRLRFARAAEVMRKSTSYARPFGVIVVGGLRAAPAAELQLLHEQLARSAKLPLWSGAVEASPTLEQTRETTRTLQALLRDGFSLTGVFAGSPSRLIESSGAYPRPLVTVLAEDPSAWRDDLAGVLAPFASFFRWWQIGADGDRALSAEPRLPEAMTNLRHEMRTFTNMPLLGAVGHSLVEPAAGRLPAEQLTLTLSSALAPGSFAEAIARRQAEEYDQLAVYVEPLPAGQYDEEARLTDWAIRMLAARHAGADTVYAAQTWDVRLESGGPVPEPRAEYLMLRTMADLVADAAPAGRLTVAPGVEALVFHHADTSVVAMWAPDAPPEGTTAAVQLGAAGAQVDLWGHRTPLAKDERGRPLVRMTRRPVLVPDVERWLMDFVLAVRMAPGRSEFGARDHSYEIVFANPTKRHLAGSVRVHVPPRWEVTPGAFGLSVAPGGTQSARVDIIYPHTEPAGVKTIDVELALNQSGYRVNVPLSLELGLSDIESWALPIIEGDDLVVQHVVTNRSAGVLHFRGSAVVPGKPRQYQPFSNLMPGETTMAEYRFTGGANLSGRRARLMLRELNDGSRIYNVEVDIP